MTPLLENVLFTLSTLGIYVLVIYVWKWIKLSLGSDHFYDLLYKIVVASIILGIGGMAFGNVVVIIGTLVL